MSIATTLHDESSVIRLPTRFDFRVMQDFRAAVDGIIDQSPCSRIIVDFASTEYLDSAALGMLLVLRDRARGSGKCVVLAKARGAVKDVLQIANFGKLFAFH